MNITNIVKSIRDIMRKDSGVDGDAQRISQLVWMLFLKIFSDKEEEWRKEIKNYISPIPEIYKWTNWAHNEELDGLELITFINDDLFPTFKKLDSESNTQAKIVKSVFEDTYNFMKNGGLVRQIINEIDKIDFKNSKDHHIFNEIYESILKELQSAGSSGEYYTPRAITQFMVDSIRPNASDTILDPACGTGGFLTSAIKKILELDLKKISLNQTKILGVEKKPLPHLLCTTNLMLHGFNEPAIIRDNFLSRPYEDWSDKDEVDVVLSNPPFGGIEEDGTEKNFPLDYRTKETADLFIVLIIRLLKTNGRAAVVLPDNFLFGEGVRIRIKEKLLAECNLHTIVRLPKGVFSPYTTVKTNLLFFEKGKPTEEVWYFEHPFPDGQKSYSKSRPIKIEEFDLEKEWWNNRVETDYAWKVPIADIRKRNFNLDISSPYYSEEQLLSSSELRDRLEKSLMKSQDLFTSLKLEF